MLQGPCGNSVWCWKLVVSYVSGLISILAWLASNLHHGSGSRYEDKHVAARLLWRYYLLGDKPRSEHQWKTIITRQVSVLVDLQLQGHQSFALSSKTYAHECKHTTTGEAWESSCSPPILPAAPLPSLIHPHQGPECLLSLSAPHCLLSFRVPCSPLWGHLVFGVGVFFFFQGGARHSL